MKVKLLKPVNYHAVGKVLEVPQNVAETWIAQRRASLVPEADPAVERMVPQPGGDRTERMMRKGRK